MENLENWINPAIKAVATAGKAILEVYSGNDFHISIKSDHSPLTLADRRADEKITAVLNKTPFPVLSEESKHQEYQKRISWDTFWLVDPLDGTKEFISRNDEFTVNIALIRKGEPVLGVIYIPVYDQLYYASRGSGAWKMEGFSLFNAEGKNRNQLISHSTALPARQQNIMSVMVSRSHLSDETRTYITNLEQKTGPLEQVTAGSSLKLCRIAEGATGIYPRFGPTMEWDIAAGVAIVKEAGGTVTVADGSRLEFNKKDLLNPWFIAVSAGFQQNFPDYL
ncbi:MAG: 3'(2'),5'-bisphosphate nucleotidase CysQ [Chlorobi bacterium]|nr:3'(2'),5'-bisphosphate nucleotidase CysQ [Chlorobiota bacterium]